MLINVSMHFAMASVKNYELYNIKYEESSNLMHSMKKSKWKS